VLKSFLDEFAEYYNSSISNLFFGVIETKSQCKECEKICYNFQIFTYLSFPLQEINQYFFNLGKRPLILPNGKNPAIEL
jgi:ubiquitin C-terminal hydrolase